ncbi:MAG TPA: 6-phosphogluconolactonase, partial [Gammaproteobacteria bacterium]|nr:6-phosphogluconolactonase [Gammaproteobacteria bacterium]
MVAEKKIMADPAALVLAAAEQFIQTADTAIKARGVCYIALAGGSTPKGLYQKLATEQYS